MDCEFVQDGRPRVPDDATATAFYRIAQEATNNALKHGDASRIELRLAVDDEGALVLSISDDGKGLPLARPNEGLGLRLMKLRAETVGAKLTILGGEEGGTRVSCTLPKGAVARPRWPGMPPAGATVAQAESSATDLETPLASES